MGEPGDQLTSPLNASNFATHILLSGAPIQSRECALLALLALHIGTGGNLTQDVLLPGTTLTISQRIESAEIASAHLPLVEDLMRLRSAFSLTVSDLARVLRVGRPTIYSWMMNRAVPRGRNVDRITMLSRLGNELRNRIGTEPNLTTFRFSGGASLPDILEQGVSEGNLRATLAGVHPAAQSRVSIAEIRRRHGFKPRSLAEQERNLREATV